MNLPVLLHFPRSGTLEITSSAKDALWRSDSLRQQNMTTSELKLGEVPATRRGLCAAGRTFRCRHRDACYTGIDAAERRCARSNRPGSEAVFIDFTHVSGRHRHAQQQRELHSLSHLHGQLVRNNHKNETHPAESHAGRSSAGFPRAMAGRRSRIRQRTDTAGWKSPRSGRRVPDDRSSRSARPCRGTCSTAETPNGRRAIRSRFGGRLNKCVCAIWTTTGLLRANTGQASAGPVSGARSGLTLFRLAGKTVGQMLCCIPH